MVMQCKVIPGVIDGQQALSCLKPDAAVLEAAKTMRERGIGAVLVVDHGRLVGIVTERDVVYRLVAAGRSIETTLLRDIMTAGPETITPQHSALEALDKMIAGRYRHLPVLDGDELCGMVSVRDLYEAIRRSLLEDLHSAETLIFGDQYGIATTA
jgi:CBS domain-containing protein